MNKQPTHVLLIEDNPGDADLMRLRLIEGKTPVQVECVNRLADGLASLSQRLPAVILLDLNLPDSHGSETFRKILKVAPDTPVVILSGREDEALARKAMNQGVQDYLVKSDVTGKNLERAMHYAVERQALLRSLELSRKQQLEFKNRFLSHVSHELRTPLSCIHQFVSLIADGLAGPITPEQHDHLGVILKSVNQLHAMIRDLLEATRAEAGKIRVEQRCVAVPDLVGQVVAMMQPLANKQHVRLESKMDAELPFVHADPDRILEVLVNLVDNAIKFTPSGGSIVVNASQVEGDPEFAYLSVADTGRGVSPEALPLIFERLYQDGISIDTNRKGLGLGLYISKELVNLHGGKIWVASHPGEGSTFSFTLPFYSLAKLLEPVLVHKGGLRPAIALVRVDLTPLTRLPRGNWKETCHQSLELLRRCVYLDKDLVLPPMGKGGPGETFFVVASTAMEHVDIMLTRVGEQLAALPQLKLTGTAQVTAQAVVMESPLKESANPPMKLEEQVQMVADRVTEMIKQQFVGKPRFTPKGDS
jgi:sigma-B regulation protein RsbU (phosphoserine phosphatase)